MANRHTTSVAAAFEILLEEMEAEIGLVNAVIARAAEQSDYERVRELTSRAEQLTELRSRASTLLREWNNAAADYTEEEEQATGVAERRNLERLQRGLRTPDEAFFEPILEVLVTRGGSARASAVIDDVEPLVTDRLRDVDYERLPSPPHEIRWRNTAHWARYSLVRQGLLKHDSPRGIWEITDEGRRWLAERRRNS